MNKSTLINVVAERSNISRSAAERAVNAMIGEMQDALGQGSNVTLVGFGTFSTYERPERRGRNPKTGESISIASKSVVKFKAGTRLLDAIRRSD